MKKHFLFMVWFIIIICLNAATAYSLLGDVNTDGSINIMDALLVSQYYVGLDPQNFDPVSGDTDCNGAVNIVDALRIAQYYVGLLSDLPECQVTTENTLTIEISGKDMSLSTIDMPYIDPPNHAVTINSKYVYETGTSVNLYFLSSTPPPMPPAGSYPIEYQTAIFAEYASNSITIDMDQDITVEIIYITHVLTPEDAAEPTPPMVGDNYCYTGNGGVFVIEPEIPLDYSTGGFIDLSGSITIDNTLPGYAGEGYVVCDGLPSSILFGLSTIISAIPYYEIRIRVWDEDSGAWTYNGYTEPRMFQIAFGGGRAIVNLSFSGTPYIMDRIVIFQEGIPEVDWQDLSRGQNSVWTQVSEVPSGEFIIR